MEFDKMTIAQHEAGNELSGLLESLQAQWEITIMHEGVPVARLVSLEPSRPERIKRVFDSIRQFRKENAGQGLSIDEILEFRNEGRR
ncbi:MAG: hypothetical protein HYV26_03615 [Candidatus Hydrogenedentes bacterium]|nr:hypothetical protein [Candidatus Hydrogenedentota bacterium]